MPPKIRRFHRHDNDVTHPDSDLVIAAGAEVLLARLVRLHPQNLERPEALGQRSAQQSPGEEQHDDQDGSHDHRVIGLARSLARPEGVETHA